MAKALEKKLNNWKPTTNTNSLLYQNQGFLIYQNKALYNGKGIYNNQADKELFMKKEAKADTKCEPKYWSYYNPLWYIGNFYSYESFESVERHCIKMGSSLGVETISKKNRRTYRFAYPFEEKDVVKAFKEDSWAKDIPFLATLKIIFLKEY